MAIDNILSNIRENTDVLRLKAELKSVDKAKFFLKSIPDEMLVKTDDNKVAD